jgi:hypothetical protein
MFNRLPAYAFAATTMLAAMPGVAQAASSYDVSTNNVITLNNDGQGHVILASPTKLTGSWQISGILNVALTYGSVDLECFAGNSRIDLALDQTSNPSGVASVSGLVKLTTPTTIGFACTVNGSTGAAVQALNAHLTLVPVASVVSSTEVAPQN